jgi:hypothetical protein
MELPSDAVSVAAISPVPLNDFLRQPCAMAAAGRSRKHARRAAQDGLARRNEQQKGRLEGRPFAAIEKHWSAAAAFHVVAALQDWRRMIGAGRRGIGPAD